MEEQLAAAWPGREQQIRQLLRLIGQPGHTAPNFFVFGPSSTCKTALVR
jgi:hypothetical protein